MPEEKQGNTLKHIGSIFKFMLKRYKFLFALVIVGILASSFAMVQSTLFTRSLIDNYITPMLQAVQQGQTPDFGPLAGAIGRLAG
ncbi:MAG: hypothetical protein Q4A07_09900, partial [Coriobacteriales bacterium]|nr:hypothetical protein [Coriobacteriales bacterium]